MLVNILFVAMFGLMTCTLPIMDALENETNAMLSLTTSGRFQIAWQSFIGVLVVSMIPAALSYLFSKGLGIRDEQIGKANKSLKMALFVWITLVICGLIGVISFWLQIHPILPA